MITVFIEYNDPTSLQLITETDVASRDASEERTSPISSNTFPYFLSYALGDLGCALCIIPGSFLSNMVIMYSSRNADSDTFYFISCLFDKDIYYTWRIKNDVFIALKLFFKKKKIYLKKKSQHLMSPLFLFQSS